MTEETEIPEEETDEIPPDTVTLKMFLPTILIGVQLVAFFISAQAPTLFGKVIGMALIPLLVNIALFVWWLRIKGLSTNSRFLGLGLYIACIIWIAASHMPNGMELTIVSITVLSTTIIFSLLLTFRASIAARKKVTLSALVTILVVFTALRVDDVAGIFPVVNWRWEPPLEISDESWGNPLVPETPAEVSASITDSDWAEFRGPNRDNVVHNLEFATTWNDTPPSEIWRMRVGLGLSSFTVVGDYMFTQEQRGENEVVVCYEANTGNQVWVNSNEGRFNESHGDGPRATPTYQEGILYTQGATGLLQALDATTGESIWQRDLTEDADTKVPVWGFASSPLLYKQSVVVFAGGSGGNSVIAYNKDDGEILWTAGSGTHGYTSGQLVTISMVPQVMFGSDVGIQSFDPVNGDLLWEHEWPVNTNPRCTQPLMIDDSTVFLGTAGGKGTRKLHVIKNDNQWIVKEQWTTRKFRPYYNDYVSFEGHLYGFDGGRLKCIDIETGKQVWRDKKNLGGQLLLIPDMKALLLLNAKGEVMLIEASPEKMRVLSQFKAVEGKTWNHPVIAGGKLFVRNSYEAACYDLNIQGTQGD
jgi:outer membrane protein assembly factor BamB